MNEKLMGDAINSAPEIIDSLTNSIISIGFKEFIITMVIILLLVFSSKITKAIFSQLSKNKELETQNNKAEADKLKELNYQEMIADNKKTVEIITNENIKYKEEAEYWHSFALSISEKYQYSISVDKLEIIIDYTLGLRSSLHNEIKSRVFSIIERGVKEDIYKLSNELYELFCTKVIETLKIFLFPDRSLYEQIDKESKEVIDSFIKDFNQIIIENNIEETLEPFLAGENGIRSILIHLKRIFKSNYIDKIKYNGFTNFLRKK